MGFQILLQVIYQLEVHLGSICLDIRLRLDGFGVIVPGMLFISAVLIFVPSLIPELLVVHQNILQYDLLDVIVFLCAQER